MEGPIMTLNRTARTILATVIRGLDRADHGQDLTEYALLTALIAVGAIVFVTGTANAIMTVFWNYIAINVPAVL
jgi:hypothetical protein